MRTQEKDVLYWSIMKMPKRGVLQAQAKQLPMLAPCQRSLTKVTPSTLRMSAHTTVMSACSDGPDCKPNQNQMISIHSPRHHTPDSPRGVRRQYQSNHGKASTRTKRLPPSSDPPTGLVALGPTPQAPTKFELRWTPTHSKGNCSFGNNVCHRQACLLGRPAKGLGL